MLTRLISLAVVCTAFLVSEVNLSNNNFPTSVELCTAATANEDAPTHNVLIIGSSRVGAGIDLSTLEKSLSDGGMSGARVGRLVSFRSGRIQQNLLLRTYLQHHGAPDSVILEATFREPDEFSNNKADGLIPMVPVSSYRSAKPGTYMQLLSVPEVSTFVADNFGYFYASHVNYIEFISHRFAQGFYHFLDNPLGLFRRVTDECSRENVEKLWWGDPSNYDKVSPPLPHEPSFLETASDDDLHYNVTYIRNMIEVLRQAGVRKITLFDMPAAAQRKPSDIVATRLKEFFPETAFVELNRLADSKERSIIASHYRDHAHLSPQGAEVVSHVLARYLSTQHD